MPPKASKRVLSYQRVRSRGMLALCTAFMLLMLVVLLRHWMEELLLIRHSEEAFELGSFRWAPLIIPLIPATLYCAVIVIVPSQYQRYRRNMEKVQAKGTSPADFAKSIGLAILLLVPLLALGWYLDRVAEEHLESRGFYRCVQTDRGKTPEWLWVHRDSWWLCYDVRAKRGRYDTPSPANRA